MTVYVTDDTFIRDMTPQPRIPTGEVERIAYPCAGSAMAGADGIAIVLRVNRY